MVLNSFGPMGYFVGFSENLYCVRTRVRLPLNVAVMLVSCPHASVSKLIRVWDGFGGETHRTKSSALPSIWFTKPASANMPPSCASLEARRCFFTTKHDSSKPYCGASLCDVCSLPSAGNTFEFVRRGGPPVCKSLHGHLITTMMCFLARTTALGRSPSIRNLGRLRDVEGVSGGVVRHLAWPVWNDERRCDQLRYVHFSGLTPLLTYATRGN